MDKTRLDKVGVDIFSRYFPYGLKFKKVEGILIDDDSFGFYLLVEMRSNGDVVLEHIETGVRVFVYKSLLGVEYKPVLRVYEDEEGMLLNEVISTCLYTYVISLYRDHYDLHGLIEGGLAVEGV